MFFKEILEIKLHAKIKKLIPLGGGDINDVYQITTGTDRFVVKINKKDRFPEMFKKESKGLQLLADGGVKTPGMVSRFTDLEYQFLILKYIEEEKSGTLFWKKFAEDLAKLHRNHNEFFGLDYNNYIGSLKQINTFKKSWGLFFIENRIIPLMGKAFDDHLLDSGDLKAFKRFFKRMDELIPSEQPALIHGDLWSGNLMCRTGQIPYFIDPAVYFGHREMDIAMTQMFGGFDRSYLLYYNDIFPMENGWQERIPIHNLYPNLVHLNLFGRSYLQGIRRVIKRF